MSYRIIPRTIFILLFLLLAIGITGAITEKEKKNTLDLKSWIDGPVRYIATSAETRDFKALKTDEERNDFIYKFWQRRDPTPLTLKNEFRERFWERVLYTNEQYAESTKPGWMTDRGKIYIIAGAPNEVENIENPDISVGMNDMRSMEDSGHRGIVRWVYQGLPGLKAAPVIIVSFYKDASGEYKLSSNPEHFEDIAPGIVPPTSNFPDPFKSMDTAGTSARIENAEKKNLDQASGPRTLGGASQVLRDGSNVLDMARATRDAMSQIDQLDRLNSLTQFQYDLAQITDTPREEQMLKARVKTLEFYTPLPQSIESYRFEDAKGLPYLVLSVGTNLKNFYKDTAAPNAIIPLSLFGTLKDVNNPKTQFLFTSDLYAPNHIVRDRDEVLLSTSVSVPPGTYDAMVGVQDLLSGRVSLYSNRIQVPVFEKGRIAMSDIILASKILTPEEGAQQVPKLIPGNLRAIQKVTHVYTSSDDLAFYFQVYEATKDASSGQPNLEITLQFYHWADTQFEKIGKQFVFPNITSQEYGRSFPLQKWPKGKYKLEVTVKDTLANTTASRESIFEVQ